MKKLSEFKSEHSERVEDLKRQVKDREAQLQMYRITGVPSGAR